MSLHARVGVERPGFSLDVALEVADGEVVAVIGPNGAGKTTLLRALAGLVPLHIGRVELAGRVLDDPAAGVRVETRERRVGVVFQDYRLFEHLSARDNVAFGPRSTGMPKREARRLADAELTRLGLADLGDRRPRELSGGQAQRVALARALVTAPELLLLDEPLAALDAETRTAVRTVLRDTVADFRGPVVLVTHDPVDALTLADRLVVVEGGRVVQAGAAAAVADRPATAYVASLVGLTLCRGPAVDGVLALEDGTRLVTADPTRQGPSLAVVRPSSVLLTREPPRSSARNVWQREVASLQVLGDRVRVTLAGSPALHADVTSSAVAELRLAAGDRVWASVKATDVTVYADSADIA
ncbi:molybdate transport system ATP-binding protein [Motilibacter peucedani]|uniref:Molybdate transport system ATP-binding protein n=1 Tax=Motilibacter peucedani TaxID=598650 RepID=A0A420XUA0_9ACTN|nr:ATP-binding cassette domain-containing protein [Motilibacter peucedani]RKS80442.1 molybdate transport system ATP-binding protein [Motilibacter peucedani]